MNETLYEYVLYRSEDFFTEYRLSIIIYYDTVYFDIREYYTDIDGSKKHTNKGVRFPCNLASLTAFLDAAIDLSAEEEGLAVLKEALKRKENEQGVN